MVLAQKLTWRITEQNRRPRHKSAQLKPTDFFIKEPKMQDGEKTASSTNVAGKNGYSHVEDWN
jgi:hypothetical protein